MKTTLSAAVLLTLSSVQAQAQSGLCAAIETLVHEARRTGEAQEPFVAQDEPFTFACGHRRESDVQRAFCEAAQAAVGLEFIHAFPWQVHDCLSARGLSPEIRTTDRYTGLSDRSRLTRLVARWPGGVRVEIRYTPFPDDGDVEERFAGYRGRYDILVEKAD